MEYMLMYCETAAEQARAEDPSQAEAYWGAWTAYIDAIEASGLVRGGNGLQPPHTASTVRVVDGQRQVHDGPFADTREHLGGYFILDCDTLEVALAWAARAPCATAGSVEVRPVMHPPQTQTQPAA